MNRTTWSLLLAVTCLAAGCGSTESEGAAGDRPAASAAWQDEANKICRDAREDSERLGDEFPTDVGGTLEYLRALNPSFHNLIKQLREVDVPAEVRRDYAEMATRYEQALKSQEALVAALETGDSDVAERESAAVTKWGDRGDEIALRLSLEECALDPGEDAPFENSP